MNSNTEVKNLKDENAQLKKQIQDLRDEIRSLRQQESELIRAVNNGD